MTPVVQWSVGLFIAIILFALGELIFASRDTDKRIGALERMQDRHASDLVSHKDRLDTHRDLLLGERKHQN